MTWGEKLLAAYRAEEAYNRYLKNKKTFEDLPLGDVLGGYVTLKPFANWAYPLEGGFPPPFKVIWASEWVKGVRYAGQGYSFPLLRAKVTYEVGLFQDDFGIFLMIVPPKTELETWWCE